MRALWEFVMRITSTFPYYVHEVSEVSLRPVAASSIQSPSHVSSCPAFALFRPRPAFGHATDDDAATPTHLCSTFYSRPKESIWIIRITKRLGPKRRSKIKEGETTFKVKFWHLPFSFVKEELERVRGASLGYEGFLLPLLPPLEIN